MDPIREETLVKPCRSDEGLPAVQEVDVIIPVGQSLQSRYLCHITPHMQALVGLCQTSLLACTHEFLDVSNIQTLIGEIDTLR